MQTNRAQQADSFNDSDPIALVVLDIYATTAPHLHQYLSEGAKVTSPDPAFESALELFENTRLGGSIIWIHAEGVTIEELVNLETHWLPVAGKAIVLIGSNQAPIVNRSLQGLMAARRVNPDFQAVVLTMPDASIANSTCRLLASQSNGWLKHEPKNANDPLASITKVFDLLSLGKPAPKPVPQDMPLRKSTPLKLDKKTASSQNASPPIPVPALKLVQDVSVIPETLASETMATQHMSVSTSLVLENNSTPVIFNEGTQKMATLNDSMAAAMQIDGAMAAALVDFNSGMALAKVGTGVNLDVAAAGNTEVLKAKMKVMAGLGLKDTIEDMLITLGTQYHLIRPVPHLQGLFLYLVLDKTKSNLAMARFKLMEVEKGITV